MDIVKKYYEIAGKLSLDVESDLRAAKVLDRLIPEHDLRKDLSRLEKIIGGNHVFVFGAGPSLRKDIKALKAQSLHKEKRFVFVAADGAAKALLEEGILPQVHVTDLDGFPGSIREVNRRGSITVVHAHGDNIPLLKELVPELKNIIGTTQNKPYGKLHNFGGFSDGDRCVFLAEHFNAGLIILAGMDFGKEVGKYAGSYEKNLKIKKLAIGKEMIEELSKESRSMILNMTSGGEEIRNVPRITAEQLAMF